MSEVASRLFMSADLIGSTAQKQQSDSKWLSGLLAFYQQFPHILQEEVNEAHKQMLEQRGVIDCPVPKLWKAVGDELLYVVDVFHERQVWVYLTAWMRSLVRMQPDVFSKVVNAEGEPAPNSGGLKGGAWLATFPWPDRRVAVPLTQDDYEPDANPEKANRALLKLNDDTTTESRGSVRVDYVGPSVDTGFRILKSASAQRFPVSLEVAWVFAHVNEAMGNQKWPIYYEDEVEMKGVWGGKGYPVFWLDTGAEVTSHPKLDKLTKRSPVSAEEIAELAEALHNEEDWPCSVYLSQSEEVAFNKAKANLEAKDDLLLTRIDTSVEIDDFDLAKSPEEEEE